MSDSHDKPAFLPLLDRLASGGLPDGEWREWRITRVAGAGNNLLYHASSGAHDLAIKFTIRDERDRAGREHAALLALRQAGLTIAPAPLWLDRDRYAQPVVVQSWLAGDVVAAPPASDLEWRRLLDHYLAIHSVTPTDTHIPIQDAVLDIRSADDALDRIHWQLTYLPELERPTELRELVRRVECVGMPAWPPPAVGLCRDDPNTLNVIRRVGAWASVDWENSGWGDPAFEIADMMAHPAYATVPAGRWEWLIEAYCEQCGDREAATRIRVYHVLMLVWWAARLARTLYEVPRGGDQRLAARPDGWQADVRAKYQRYLGMAEIELARS